MQIDTDDVERIRDPLDRSLAADTMLAEVQRKIDYLKEVRAAAMRELVRKVGGFQAADALNISRASMYRAISKGVSSEAVERDDMHWHRQALVINDRLRKQGKTKEGINIWWNATIQPGLDDRTPMQAWSAGDYDAVLALVR